MEKHAKHGIWRENIGGWVGKKDSSFLVEYLYLIHIKARISSIKMETAGRRCYYFWQSIKLAIYNNNKDKGDPGVYMESVDQVVQVNDN